MARKLGGPAIDVAKAENATITLQDGKPFAIIVDTASRNLVVGGKTLKFDDPSAAITVITSGLPHTIASARLIPDPSEGVRAFVDGVEFTISTASSMASTTPLSSPKTSPGTTATPSAPLRTDSTTAASSETAATGSMPSPSMATPPSPPRGNTDKGLSKGAAAGIGVGCAIAGALIAALIVFAIMRGRRKSRSSRSYPLQEKPGALSKSNGTANANSAASGAFVKAESSLPLPLEDAAIGGEISRLQTLVKNYAQSYYHTSPVAGKTPDLSALGSNLSIPPATLAAMLANPRTRIVAIRYCLAWVIFSRLGLDSDASTSLLPPEVAGCARPMSADTASKSSNLSLAPWRALTHSLLTPTYPASSSTPLNGPSLQSAVSTLDTILQPYADTSRDSYERMTKLEEIVKRGAKFGWTLFGQVSCYDFDWQRRTQGEVGIFPALLQTVNEKGEKLGGRGRILWEGEGTRVEGV